jgi:hypothetical protein
MHRYEGVCRFQFNVRAFRLHKDFTPPVLSVGMIFHRARELRDNNLIFCGPLAGPADRHRLSLARCPGVNRTSEVSAMTTLERTAIVVGVGSAQGLGAALARRFAVAGHRAIVSGRARWEFMWRMPPSRPFTEPF